MCVKRGEKTAHEVCKERGLMDSSDYERKPRTAEKSSHVMLEKSWERINTKLDFSECPQAKANPRQTSLGQRAERWGGGWLSTLRSGTAQSKKKPRQTATVCFMTRKLTYNSEMECSKITCLHLLHGKPKM